MTRDCGASVPVSMNEGALGPAEQSGPRASPDLPLSSKFCTRRTGCINCPTDLVVVFNYYFESTIESAV